MSKRIFIRIAVAALIVLPALCISCKKDKNTGYDAARIVGVWTKTFDASDYNGNNSLDAIEKIPLQAGNYEYAYFNSNGTFMDSSGYTSYSFNKSWGIYSVSGGYVTGFGPFGESSRIIQLDDHNLIVEDTGMRPVYWIGYTK